MSWSFSCAGAWRVCRSQILLKNVFIALQMPYRSSIYKSCLTYTEMYCIVCKLLYIWIAVLFALMRSFLLQVADSRQHASRCSMVCDSPQSQRLFSLYPHVCISAAALPKPVRSLFKLRHISQGWWCPEASFSAGGRSLRLLVTGERGWAAFSLHSLVLDVSAPWPGDSGSETIKHCRFRRFILYGWNKMTL